ncbi:uncharacterized protein LOC135922670 [Gordionus sp. m RMFG-2023]|uniref:uncharacterized protein LOC135922670 n=1 Tax=Gordionus sp. m RMFG-2023 TaxID=3053472 RepID=UPI0031FC1946
MHKINYSLFVGNIPLEITQERLTLLFNQTGNVKYCSMFNRKCFIDYQTVLECENAIKKFNGHEVVPTKKLLVKFSDNTKKRLLQEKYPGMLESAENSSSKAAITKTNAVPPKVNGPGKALQNKTTLPPKKSDQIEMGNNKNDSEVVIGNDDASSAPKPCFSNLNCFYDKKAKEALPLELNANKVNSLAPKNGVSDIKGDTKNNLNGTVRVTPIPNSDTNIIPPYLNTKSVYKVTNNGIVKVKVDDNLVSDEDAASNIFPKYVKVVKPPNAVEHAKAYNETKNSDVSDWPYIKSDDVGINKELQVLKTNINDELLTDIENKRISDDNISSPIVKVSKNDERPINIEKSKKNGFKNEADDFVLNVTGDSFYNMK